MRELGSGDPFDLVRIDYREKIYEAWAPLGFLVHVAPTNAFTVGALSVIEGLLAGNICFLKTGGADSLFAQLLLHRLGALDLTGTLAAHIYVARISSAKQDLLRAIFSNADGVAAWGGETGIEGTRKLAPLSARFVDWGPKISFAYFARGSFENVSAVDAVAREICLLEQQACSSPQCVFVETEDRAVLDAFANRLAASLQAISPGVPRLAPGPAERAEITQVTEVARAEAALDLAHVIESDDGTWRILVEYASGLRASPLYRTVWVKPLPRAKILRVLRPLRAYLQTTGVVCEDRDLAELTHLLIQAGVLRVTAGGRMLESYVGEPHDGVYALPRYCRRISLQSTTDVARISDLAELAVGARVEHAPILTKEAFQDFRVDDRYSELFFKSGGSSGEPKLSVFTYADYHEQMRLAAEGLLAAGLDPARDRCMNLFFGGGLYGGFVSFFTILETLRARQFPMAAHADHEFVAQTIVDQKITTLLGMPSYLMQLFSKNDATFKKYCGVEKIFYGGEHLGETQKRKFHSDYGVKLIRSATYGSVDAGPLGYQCVNSDGSAHHLHARLHRLEILELDRDEPATPGEPGRLIFTSLIRQGQRIERYEVGDLGRWIPDPCPCGRTSPRFELLGRHGDVFRIGSGFLTYGKFSRYLEDRLEFNGELQLVLSDGTPEILTLRTTSAHPPARLREILLEEYTDLREIVVSDGTLALEIVSVQPEELARTSGSGKLLHIVDRRAASQAKL